MLNCLFQYFINFKKTRLMPTIILNAITFKFIAYRIHFIKVLRIYDSKK
jgi:hypothetical protein